MLVIEVDTSIKVPDVGNPGSGCWREGFESAVRNHRLSWDRNFR